MKRILFVFGVVGLFGIAGFLLWQGTTNSNRYREYEQVLAERKESRVPPGQTKKGPPVATSTPELTPPPPASANTPKTAPSPVPPAASKTTPSRPAPPVPARADQISSSLDGGKSLRKGSSGQEVKQLQESLSKFPEIYPQGLASGLYGNLTENAVKNFQKALGLPQSGVADGQTRGKLEEIDRALARKQPPKISEIAPAEISSGTIVTLTGSGFSAGGNSLFIRGRTALSDLTSSDGATIVFSLPEEIPCIVGQACPVKIVNANGISNAKVFKLADIVTAPPPEPSPPPAPEPAPSPCIPVTLNVPVKYLTIQGAIDAATCPGTIIQIAAGTYYEILVLKSDIILLGAGPGVTIIDGSKTEATLNPWGYLVQNFNVITAGKLGAGVQNVQIKNLSITGSGAYGDNAAIRIQDSSNVLVENVLFYRNTDGLRIYGSTPVTVKNVTLAGNRNGVMSHGISNITVKNSIITQNSAWGLYAAGTSVQLTSTYNALWGNGTNYDGVVSGVGDIALEPRLGAAPQYLVAAGSTTIDAGDAADAYSLEPLPNGGRINMGSYGNTPWATTSTISAPLPPPAAPTLISISPSVIATGMRATLNGTGFTTIGNTITFTGSFTQPNQTISAVASSDGVTLDVTIPSAMPCRPEVVSECSVYVTNQNGRTGNLSFWLGQHIDPVTVLSPNGGEQLRQGINTIVSASGGKSEAFSGSISVSYALVEASATTASDPSALIAGWIQHDGSSFAWNATRLCDFDNANSALPAPGSCWDASPGNYKVLAVGRDMMNLLTIWDASADRPGNIDLSDQPFSITPAVIPSLSVVSPNGGEAYKYADAVTIVWNAENIASKQVNIKLLKAGSVVSTIVANVPQSAATGLFLYNWIVPNNLPLASDYTIEISDAANAALKDTSDGQFKIVSNVALKLLRPNEGEIAMRGFKIPLIWEYTASVPSAGITVNLYKDGIFQQTLATNLLHQGITGISSEDWQRYFQNHSPYPSFALISVPDVPDDAGYTLELVNGADSSIRDQSDMPFHIMTLPSPITFKGRMVDALTKAPIPNATFGGYTSQYPYTLPRFTSNANGEFSYATTTNDLISLRTGKGLFYGGNGACNNITSGSIYRYADLPRASLGGGWFSWLAPYSSTRSPLTTPEINFGDIPLWPTARQIYTYTDIPAQLGIYYQKDDGTIGGGGGNSLYKMAHTLSYPFPLGFNTRIQFTDKAGGKYVSPFAYFGTDVRCPIAALSFMDGVFQWEPYPIGITYSWTGGTVGTFTKATLTTLTYTPYRGAAPFTWKLLGGTLPPGMTFDAQTATLSGIPTTAGAYIFDVRVTDANGVRASQSLTITIR